MEFYENSQSPERALLIGVDTGEYNAEISMEELALLSETAGAEIIGTVIQKLEAPSRQHISAAAEWRRLPPFVEITI